MPSPHNFAEDELKALPGDLITITPDSEGWAVEEWRTREAAQSWLDSGMFDGIDSQILEITI